MAEQHITSILLCAIDDKKKCKVYHF